jgi:hypothetical protein
MVQLLALKGQMMGNHRDGGKGDKPRPMPNREQFESNWESIFGNKQKTLKDYIEQKQKESDDIPKGS